MEKTYKKLVKGLADYCKQNGFKKAVLGLSGGVDSSLTLKIAVDALGAENVTGILMPEIGLTKEENMIHAKGLADYFGVKTYNVSINSMLVPFNTVPWHPSTLAQMNTKARVRMVTLYTFANTERAIVLGTSNKSECMLGYGTKYGDAASDIFVIGDLLKTQVWKLAEHLGLPDEIVKKAPSAELISGQTDEGELGATYRELDQILVLVEKECADMNDEKEVERAINHITDKGLDPLHVRKVFRLIRENQHKGKIPPIIRV